MQTLRIYTEEELTRLRSMPKRVTNPRARWLEKPKARPAHRQRGYHVSGSQEEARFEVYQRQNLTDENDFSCGIAYLPHGSPPLTLARYNGPSHPHGEITYLPHIHLASEQAMAAGRRPESGAQETDRFSTLEGALACLIEDFSLSGLDAQPDQPRLL